VAVVKHSHHSPDLSGKDSERFSSAGAELVVFSGRTSFATFGHFSEEFVRILPVDVVLIEGYSQRSFGSQRYTIRQPSEAARLVARILRSCPLRAGSPVIVTDGRRVPADPLWRLVRNAMAVRNVGEVRVRK
jgi:molybdopterin-guanine dinucleotide biosynthesis protein MobB